MRLICSGILVAGVVGLGQVAQAQGSWTPQASPTPQPPTTVYVGSPLPAPAAAPKPGKAKPAKPATNVGTWLSINDYPPEAVRTEAQGTTSFRLTIDKTGKPIQCDITGSSGSASLDQTTCRLMMERAWFTPAFNDKGKPTEGTWASRIRWVIPGGQERTPPAPSDKTMSFVVEPDGSVSNCQSTLDRGSGFFEGADGPCGKGQIFKPYTDAQGNPVRRKVTINVEISVTDPDK